MDAETTRNELDQVRNAISFIATQAEGPKRLLAHHRESPSGLCVACSVVNHVRWPCPTASMALLAEAKQQQPDA